jgi:GA-binding protein transcription factor beta
MIVLLNVYIYCLCYLQSDTLVTLQVGNQGAKTAGRSCLSPVELGKRLLVYSRDGDTEEVKNLISRGAPFTTDWVCH